MGSLLYGLPTLSLSPQISMKFLPSHLSLPRTSSTIRVLSGAVSLPFISSSLLFESPRNAWGLKGCGRSPSLSFFPFRTLSLDDRENSIFDPNHLVFLISFLPYKPSNRTKRVEERSLFFKEIILYSIPFHSLIFSSSSHQISLENKRKLKEVQSYYLHFSPSLSLSAFQVQFESISSGQVLEDLLVRVAGRSPSFLLHQILSPLYSL